MALVLYRDAVSKSSFKVFIVSVFSFVVKLCFIQLLPFFSAFQVFNAQKTLSTVILFHPSGTVRPQPTIIFITNTSDNYFEYLWVLDCFRQKKTLEDVSLGFGEIGKDVFHSFHNILLT